MGLSFCHGCRLLSIIRESLSGRNTQEKLLLEHSRAPELDEVALPILFEGDFRLILGVHDDGFPELIRLNPPSNSS
jgi:hypothetical protein